jgi:ABC-type oligopeptide transport system ATPase subunit
MEDLLEIKDLKKYFFLKKGLFSFNKETIKAVDNISFSIKKGEILGLVGESGSGKSTIAKLIVRLIYPQEGKIFFKKEEIGKFSREKLSKNVQMIFQDPFASLNPKLSIGTIIGEVVRVRNKISGEICSKGEVREEIKRILATVGLPINILSDYPHQFSGGQRQRIGIARALAMRPRLIIADEPVSSLDISIQAQIINLLLDLKEEFNLSFLFIAHDLNLVKYLSQRMLVMYKGKIVEEGLSEEIYRNPQHSYTQQLIESIPKIKYWL